MKKFSTELRRARLPLILAAAVAGALTLAIVASANHPEASLTGSNFEIDVDANLKVDDPAPPSLDWANVSENRQTDQPTGKNDDSYAGGAKEDDTCPGTTTGSIPNNKSDLLHFGVYEEEGDPGFLNLFWTRVNEPSGTTLMDFELNQSSEDCGNGVNPVRTEGDLLIEYRIEQGGATANIKVREWTGSAWGPAEDLTGSDAAGTINTSAIPAADSDGLITSGSLSPRTFGEAQIDLDVIFDEGKCESFGSAFLKSRASDAFTSQMKDYIAPVPITLTNCGKVIIRKQTDPDEDPNTTEFGFAKQFDTDPSSSNAFNLKDDGVQTFANVLFGTGYTVSENTPPAGWALADIDCSASSGVTATIGADGDFDPGDTTVTFDIDDADDVLDCTYTNRLQLGAILITKTRKHAASGPGDHPHAGVEFTVTGGDLPAAGTTVTTDANGEACVDGLLLSSSAGDYTVAESVPSGYNADGDTSKTVTVSSTSVCGDGNEATVSFSNTPLTDITVSVNSQVDGGTASTIECEPGGSASTGVGGDGSLTLSDKEPGIYVCTVDVDP